MISRPDCVRADAADPLAGFRDEFELPDGVIYLDGNSLGPRPRTAEAAVRTVVADEWGNGLIRSWNTAGWFDLPNRLGDQLAPLIGAGPGTTLVTDTTSLNLYKVLGAALDLQRRRNPGRRVILSERDNFPTDLYVAEGLLRTLDRDHELRLVDAEQPLSVGDDVAVLMLSHVNYRTGAMWDLPAVTAQAREAGALAVWDLAHSAGAVPVDLTAADADFAVGCTYKYLNGGPGAPAFLWVNPRHHETAEPPLTGWWGHARPFAMEPSYRPASGVRRYLFGTQPVVALTLVSCGLDIAGRADMAEVRRKSLSLTDLFIALVERRCPGHDLSVVTPLAHHRRGSQVSVRHPEGFAVVQALIDRGVIGDYREPGLMRFGLTPLYLRHVDVWDAVEVLRDVLDTGAWDRADYRRRATVT